MSDFQPGTFTINSSNWPQDQKFQDFATFLGLKFEKDKKGVTWPYSQKTAQKLEDLYRWGKVKAKSLEHDDVKGQVYRLTKKVGVNYIGETLLDRLWQHIQFDSRISQGEYKELERKEEKAKEVHDGKAITIEKSGGKKPVKTVPATIKPIRERNVQFRAVPAHEIYIINRRSKPIVTESL